MQPLGRGSRNQLTEKRTAGREICCRRRLTRDGGRGGRIICWRSHSIPWHLEHRRRRVVAYHGKCGSWGLLRGERILPAPGTMPMLYVSLEVEPGDIVLTTMLTDRHAINTMLANVRCISSGVWGCDWRGIAA